MTSVSVTGRFFSIDAEATAAANGVANRLKSSFFLICNVLVAASSAFCAARFDFCAVSNSRDSGSVLNGIMIVRLAVCTRGVAFLASASLPAAAERVGRLGRLGRRALAQALSADSVVSLQLAGNVLCNNALCNNATYTNSL